MSVQENLTLKDFKRYMRFHWFNELGGGDMLIDGTKKYKKNNEDWH